ncbi:MAG TPA: hypothetical protein VIQ03_10105, partial [Gammaproteobacteria bacterium]
MKIIKLLLMPLCLVYLSACSISGGTIPSDHFYRLPAINIESVSNLPQAIKIKPVKVDGLYHERNILYVDQNEPLEVKRYSYHYWVETPASLIHKSLSAYLSVNKQVDAKAAIIELIPTLLNFERLVSPGKAEAYIKFHIEVNHLSQPGRSFTKTYEARIASSSMNMHDTVSAFGEALGEI